MNNEDKLKIETYKKEATVAAKDLRYGYGVIAKIDKAKTYNEICRIMIDARHEKENKR